MTKYRNKPIVIDGIKFHSQKEGARYLALKERKDIENLELQPVFKCELNGVKICKYIADFRYYDQKLGQTIIEDVKGFKTAVYKLKNKLVKALFNINIVEI